MRRALRPLGAYHELPLCVVPAPAPGQAAQDAGGGSSGGGWAVNTDMGFVSAPVTASAAEVHEHVEVQPHHSMLFGSATVKSSGLAGRHVRILLGSLVKEEKIRLFL